MNKEEQKKFRASMLGIKAVNPTAAALMKVILSQDERLNQLEELVNKLARDRDPKVTTIKPKKKEDSKETADV